MAMADVQYTNVFDQATRQSTAESCTSMHASRMRRTLRDRLPEVTDSYRIPPRFGDADGIPTTSGRTLHKRGAGARLAIS